MFSKTNIKAVAFKEYKHIKRDPFTMLVALFIPLILVLFFGFIIELDYKNIRITVQDNDNTQISRRFVSMFEYSQYFKVKKTQGQLEIENELLKNNSSALLIIKNGFGKAVVKGETAKSQVLIDGSDNSKSAVIAGYLTGIAGFAQKNFGFPQNDIVRTRFLFNAQLNGKWFCVPGLATIIIGLIAVILMSLTIAKEWENGSMELLLSTPIKPIEIVLGKIFPYFVLNMLSVLSLFIISVFIFGLPFRGNFLIYLFACVIYVCGALALGTLISVLMRNQQTAVQFAFAVGLLPSLLFSGFIFSIENMPFFFRCLTALFPQRWFMEISRFLFLRDANWTALYLSFAAISVFAFIMIFLAAKKFKTDLEP